MGIRIDRISIDRGGPLKEDFSFEPGSFNLIYGHNETGKTYIVEAMLDILFRTGKNTPWIKSGSKSRVSTVRDWKHRGQIVVSGLEDKPVTFVPGGRKLEDFSNPGSRLPEELSRLMVVRAGDTKLSSAIDGVGSEILSTYLTGRGVLDEVENSIQHKAVKNATIKNGTIDANQQGLVSDRLKAKGKVEELRALQLKIDSNASLGAVNTLERKIVTIGEELKKLEDARRHRAFLLNNELRQLELAQEELPSDHELQSLGTDVMRHRDMEKELKRTENKFDDDAELLDNYEWMQKAAGEYLSHPDALHDDSFRSPVCTILLFIFIAATVAAGFFSKPLMVGSAIGALICLLIHLRRKTASIPAVTILNRENLEREFQRRFHRELTDPAVLQLESQKLEKEYIQFNGLREGRANLIRDMETRKKEILAGFYAMTGENIAVENWDDKMSTLRNDRKEVQQSILSLSSVFASLNIDPDSYLPESPGTEWDQAQYLKLVGQLESVSSELAGEKQNIEILKTEISVVTGINNRDIRQLLTALEDKMEIEARSYRDITARILAENQVFRAVSEFRKQENDRLEEVLESGEVLSILTGITGRYTGLKMDGKGSLLLTTPRGEEYPLEQLSTGAAEQVYIALRIAFARRSMGQPAFLVFDDAFQHSDWSRRENLVRNVMELVRDGWQIFYFTMDDHLQRLFRESGKEFARAEFINLDG